MKTIGYCTRIVSLFSLLVGLTAGPASGAVTNFVEGFETGIANWIVGDGNPTGTAAYWGRVDSAFGGEGTHGGGFKAYCAATGHAGSINSPAYRDDMTAYLTRTLNLAGMTNATLSFWSRIPGIEASYDYARVLINNTELWSTDQPQTAWTLVTLSLESYLGGTHTLRFELSTDGSITHEGWYLDDITLTDAATPAPPPTNDNFSASQLITGAIGSFGGTTRGATAQAGEPDPGNSVWYHWTPYTNGLVTFRTGGSAFDTVLCIYTGSALTSLTPVGCDDNSGTNSSSVLAFNATANVTYRISVHGAGSGAGFVLLSWDQPNGLGAELLPDLWVWADQSRGFLYGWYLDQNEPTVTNRTLLRVSGATPNTGTGNLELRGSSTTPGVYQRIFRADGSSYERYAGTFTFHAGHGHLHFDNWVNLYLRAVLTNDGVGGIVAAGDKTSFAIIDLTRYNGTRSGQYSGGLIQGLTVGWADVYSASLQDMWVDVTDVPSGRYWLEAIVDPANSILELNESNNAARILIDYTNPGGGTSNTNPPPNDHFASGITLAGITAGAVGTNANATREASEPVHWAGNTHARSVWWRWTAPSTATVTMSTDGSSFDTIMAVYRGSTLNALTHVATDDDAGVGNSSLVTFAATAGTLYHIAVDGFSSAVGPIQLNINPAWNNAFANCLSISGASGSASGSTRGGSREASEPNHAGVSGSSSIWYCWTAPFTGPFTFDTIGSSFDTLLGIYTGSALNALTPIASDNNTGGNGTSRAAFNAVSNTSYRIAVDGASSGVGVVRLNWTGPAAPGIVAQPSSTNVPAGAAVTFRVTASGATPLAYQWRHAGTNLVNSDYVSGAQTATLLLPKVLPADAGPYEVFVSSPYGNVTSFPANLIVLDNPRVVHVEDTDAAIGGIVTVPIAMQAVGDENSLRFSLVFDPARLTNPRFTNGAALASATTTLNTSQLASGHLGVTMAMPAGQTVAAGSERDVTHVLFDVTGGATPGTTTFVGFGDLPVNRLVTKINDTPLTTLFAAGLVTLRSVPSVVSGGRLPDGRFRLTLSGLPGRSYDIEASSDLETWTAVATIAAGLDGLLEFTDPESLALPHRFYQARLVPAP